jgi:hypothetical protein
MARTFQASLVVALAVLAGCTAGSNRDAGGGADSAAEPGEGAAVTDSAAPAADSAGWRRLFDGRTLAGWRGFRSDTAPAGWVARDGILARTGAGGDIMTVDQFGDFELELEWRISEGGNSGIMYRVTEEAEAPYETGPEMQVLDDERHSDGKSQLTSAGSLFGLYPAPREVVRPAGEWNEARIVADSTHLEHWLNGQKVVETEIGTGEWDAKIADSKFAAWPGFAKARRGHIVLQDHGDVVEYRNIRIREIR